jgi:uncharacterized protein YjbJ (UPF0337 family)
MNKDQVKGAAKDVAGKIQEKTGKLVGNPTQEVKGMKHQMEGKMQEQVGNVKERMKDAKKV